MSSSPEIKSEKKRKRVVVPEDDDDKLEIDINLPEPPSKKAKRKEKKAKAKTVKVEKPDVAANEELEAGADDAVHPSRKVQVPLPDLKETNKRSDFGIWVGNLSFKTTKDSLRKFLLTRGGIDEASVTRVHLPMNDKQQNKGFAYVDFSSEAVLNIALGLSEQLVDGRKVLIKNAKSFEGRPEKTKADANAATNGVVSKKPPSKRIFVGNLGFDMTRDELSEHFAQAGKIDDVFLATFEDSGKCKGFGWITFADVEAAEVAVRGFIWKKQEEDEEEVDKDVVENDSEDNSEEEKKPAKKVRKKRPTRWFINKVHGRLLRCEFAEDKQTRYNKRYGKGAPSKGGKPSHAEDDVEGGAELNSAENLEGLAAEAAAAREAPKKRDPNLKKLDKDQRQELRRRKHDARLTAPGKALANTQRASGAIVEAKGTKAVLYDYHLSKTRDLYELDSNQDGTQDLHRDLEPVDLIISLFSFHRSPPFRFPPYLIRMKKLADKFRRTTQRRRRPTHPPAQTERWVNIRICYTRCCGLSQPFKILASLLSDDLSSGKLEPMSWEDSITLWDPTVGPPVATFAVSSTPCGVCLRQLQQASRELYFSMPVRKMSRVDVLGREMMGQIVGGEYVATCLQWWAG